MAKPERVQNMENEKPPRGQRITRIRFSLLTQSATGSAHGEQPKVCETTVGRMESGEFIESLWCDIAADFVTITMMVSPEGFGADMKKSVADIISFATPRPNELTARLKEKLKKEGHSKPTPEAIEGAKIAEADAILLNMIANVERIERRQKIYKTVDIAGAIELTSYTPPSDTKGFSVRNTLPKKK